MMGHRQVEQAAVGAASNDPAVRERIAARIFNFAMRGERNSNTLYLKTIGSFGTSPIPHYVSG